MLASTEKILDTPLWFKLITFLCVWLVAKYTLIDPSLYLPFILQILAFPQYRFSWLLYVVTMSKLGHQRSPNRLPSPQSEAPATFKTRAGDCNTDSCNIQVQCSAGTEPNPHVTAQARAGNNNKDCANITASHGHTTGTYIPQGTLLWIQGEHGKRGGKRRGGTTSGQDTPPYPPATASPS